MLQCVNVLGANIILQLHFFKYTIKKVTFLSLPWSGQCVFSLEFGIHVIVSGASHLWCVCPYVWAVSVCVLLTAAWSIPWFSSVAVCGSLCVMPMHRGLYVIAVGLWKPPAIWTPVALDLCLSIRQLLLIAQSQDSVLWLRILYRLNTLICNKIWDLNNPWPWDWPDNAELKKGSV